MTDRYIIEDLTTDDLEKLENSHPNTEATVKLIETGYKPINIGYYTTKEEAEKSKAEWIARDELQEKVSDFLDKMLTEFNSRLQDDEIREILREA